MRIYVAHSRDFDFRTELYAPLRQSRLNEVHTIILPHETSDEPFGSRGYLARSIDLIVAEVSEPSTGLGIELGWADAYGVPILCVYRQGARISGSLRTVTDRFVGYASREELIEGIGNTVEELLSARST